MARFENSTVNLVIKSCKTFGENKLHFSQNWHFFYICAGQNTILTKPKDLFSYRNPLTLLRISPVILLPIVLKKKSSIHIVGVFL